MKKIFITLLIIFLVLSIFYIFKDRKVYYTSINSFESAEYAYDDYIVDYLKENNVYKKSINIINKNYRITDLIHDIETNKEYSESHIKNILIKTDLLTLSVGYSDLIEKIPFYNTIELMNHIDSYMLDLEKLFKLLRSYDKETIIFIGYINNFEPKYDNTFKYINDMTESLTKKYNIHFIDITGFGKQINSEYLLFDNIRNIIDKIIKNKI